MSTPTALRLPMALTKRVFDIAIVTLAAAPIAVSWSSPGDEFPSHEVAAQELPALTLVTGARRPGRWQQLEIRGSARRVDVYVARDDTPKPVVVLLHGSGCGPDFTANPDGSLHETSVFQDAIEAALATVHVAIIDRPGVDPLVFTDRMGTADKLAAFTQASRLCSDEFLTNATKPARVDDAVATITVLARQSWARRFVVAGHSEGTHVVTGLLRRTEINGAVVAAGLFASAGPIAFFGGYAARPTPTREDFNRVFERVRTVQSIPDDAMWEGLPGRRWRTFWLETPIDDVRDSSVPLFVAQGSADGSTLPADLFALEALRQRPSRPIRYVVVEGGNHAFEAPPGRSRMPELFGDFLRWSLDEQRVTGPGQLR